MSRQTRNWLIFAIGSVIIMLIMIPSRRRPKLLPFGFFLGFIQAIVLNWIAVKRYKLWKMPGDFLINGIPLLTSISWIAPSIIFAHHFPFTKKWTWKVLYIFFFAVSTTIVQHLQKIVGMWENINWRTIYTFPLATVTHTLMAAILQIFNIKNIRERSILHSDGTVKDFVMNTDCSAGTGSFLYPKNIFAS